MIDKYKKNISWRFIFALLFSVAIIALLFFALPISVVNPSPVLGVYNNSDSATGFGTPINSKGNWFMYNTYSGGSATYNIQAGNPKNGTNTVGTYTVTANSNGTYTVSYNLNPGVNVVNAQLSVSSSPNFTGKPGQDANQNFNQSFTAPNNSGSFNVFAHFDVQY
jgi:hypothetical protein